MELVRSLLSDKVALYQAAPKIDDRGSLIPVDFIEIGFPVKRIFMVKAASNVTRGGHGHYRGRQLLMHVSGTITVELRFKGEIVTQQLTSPGNCLLIEPGVWASQKYADDTTELLVCCDTRYDASDYFLDETDYDASISPSLLKDT